MYSKAILQLPAVNFADGLTSQDLGVPDYSLALMQHQAYQRALVHCGIDLTILPSDTDFPDSTFVEDVAVIVQDLAILTCPGAESRLGEVTKIKPTLERFFNRFASIISPGTLDGGDICEAGKHFFIGISQRTNEAGANQLSSMLNAEGFSTDFIDIRKVEGLLHLKSGLAALDNNTLVVAKPIADHLAFKNYDLIIVDEDEQYAANCIRVNGFVLIPEGYPKITHILIRAGYQLLRLDMSEFRKMDGGLSCLSLRF